MARAHLLVLVAAIAALQGLAFAQSSSLTSSLTSPPSPPPSPISFSALGSGTAVTSSAPSPAPATSDVDESSPSTEDDSDEYGEYSTVQITSESLKYNGSMMTAFGSTPITNYGASSYGCGLGYVDDNFTTNFIGVGKAYFNSGYSCGQCVKVRCEDDQCEEKGRTLVAEIVDVCGNCEDAGISVPIGMFLNLTARTELASSTALVSWEFVDCSPYISGTIKMLVKSGGTIYYQAFNFSNSRYVITAAEINGERLTHGADNYWSWNPGSPISVNGNFAVAILASTGEILSVSGIKGLKSTDLGVQFKAAS